jgi:uncharacterized protein YndB with AHSA1/START domain
MTTQGSESIVINAAPEAVWPWISDLTRHGQWSPKEYSVELVSGEAGAVGSTYRSVGWVPPNDKNHVNEVTITEAVAPSRLVLAAQDGGGTFTNTFEMEPVDGGTRVTYTLVFPPMKGLNAVLVPILFPLVGKSDLKKRMALLKTRVESPS